MENEKEIIKTDMFLFEDARDMFINLREQDIGTDNVEDIFDKRAKDLDKILKGMEEKEIGRNLEVVK